MPTKSWWPTDLPRATEVKSPTAHSMAATGAPPSAAESCASAACTRGAVGRGEGRGRGEGGRGVHGAKLTQRLAQREGPLGASIDWATLPGDGVRWRPAMPAATASTAPATALVDWLQHAWAHPRDDEAEAPIGARLTQLIRRAILERVVPPAHRLPSTRALAQALRIARNTVVPVYEQLRAEGFVVAGQGSGTYVCRIAPDALPVAAKPAHGASSRAPRRPARLLAPRPPLPRPSAARVLDAPALLPRPVRLRAVPAPAVEPAAAAPAAPRRPDPARTGRARRRARAAPGHRRTRARHARRALRARPGDHHRRHRRVDRPRRAPDVRPRRRGDAGGSRLLGRDAGAVRPRPAPAAGARRRARPAGARAAQGPARAAPGLPDAVQPVPHRRRDAARAPTRMAAVRRAPRHAAAGGRLRQRVPLRRRAVPVAAGPGRAPAA